MKKILSGILAAATVLSCASMAAFAAGEENGTINFAGAYNSNDESIAGVVDVTNPNKIDTQDTITPGRTIYIPVVNYVAPAADGTGEVLSPTWETETTATTKELKDDDLFKFSTDKDKNSKMIKNIELLTDKRIDGTRYDVVLKFELADSMTTSEINTDGTVKFTAKRDSSDKDTTLFHKGDEIEIDYSFWINNAEQGNDDNPDAGDRIYYKPEKNEKNTLIWGDDLAALQFEADDDAGKFYARLQTTADRSIYADYADPVDADIWFFDFVSAPTIPSTSRATLTLGIPWDQDGDYAPNPDDAFIYERDADGTLTDVTDKFTFSEDDQEIAGWSIKTRQLGAYIISDTELDTAIDEEPVESEEDSSSTVEGDKDIPQTGSSDMVNVAVVAAVVALGAAGAVAFRKASK